MTDEPTSWTPGELEELSTTELEPEPIRPTGRRPRLPLVVGALAVTVGVAAFAVGAVTGGTASAGGGIPLVTTPSTSFGAGWTAPGGMMGPGGMYGLGRGGRMGHGPAGQISIAKIDGSKLSLTTTDGWTRTIDTAGATITKGGQSIALADLKVGDQIVFGESRQTDGTFKITSIQVVLPQVEGTVTAVGASSLTLTQRDGTSKTVTLTGSTTYRLAGQASSKSAIAVGSIVDAQGTTGSGGSFTASVVEIQPAAVMGTVTAKTNGSITIKDRGGASVIVKVGSSTTYQVAGATNATIANIAVGDVLVAQGTRNSDGSLSASVVRAGQAGSGPGFGKGFGRGFGHGMGGGFGGTSPADPAPGATPSGSASGA